MEVWKVECYIISKDVSDCTSEKCWCVCAYMCAHACTFLIVLGLSEVPLTVFILEK